MGGVMTKKKLFIVATILLSVILSVCAVLVFAVVIPNAKKEKEWKELVKQYYANKIEKYQEENDRYQDYEVDVVFLGDSLTDGYDVESYYSEFVVSNRGIGGDTTVGLEQRLAVSVYDLKPKVIVMLIGANNMDTMLSNYERILTGFQENLPNTKVVLLSLTAMGGELWGRKNQLAAYNNVSIKKYAEKYGYYFVDLFSPLFDESIGEVYAGYTVDGGHFTSLGYDVVTSLVKPAVTQALADYNN